MTENKEPENRPIDMEKGNYNESIGRDYLHVHSKVFVHDGGSVYIHEANEEPLLSLNKNKPAKSASLPSEQGQQKLIGEKIFEEHKYDGKLATIEIDLYEIIDSEESEKKVVKLSISFGTLEIKIPKINQILNRNNQTIDIKFGLKNAELCFHFKNGIMPLKERKTLVSQCNAWKGIPKGISESPSWEFGSNYEPKTEVKSRILHGIIANEILGIIEVLEKNKACEFQAFLIVSINRNSVEIIDFDDGNNKKQKETKIGLLLRYLKNELENYVSKVVIRYDTATIS